MLRLLVTYLSLNATSGSSAYRLADFTLLPTISQHRSAALRVFPLSRQKRSSLYVYKQALAPLFWKRCLKLQGEIILVSYGMVWIAGI